MARIIEPIGLLTLRRLLLLHPTKYSPSPFTLSITNSYASSNGTILRRLFTLDSSFSSRCNTSISIRSFSESVLPETKPKKQKKPVSPETKRKAQVVKQLYKINKGLFGELLENSKEKSQRVKKEMKKPKQLAVPIRDDDYYLNPIIDPTAELDLSSKEKQDSQSPFEPPVVTINTPKSLPMSEKVTHQSGVPETKGEKAKTIHYIYNKEAEINWALKSTKKMTKVLKGNFNKVSSTTQKISSDFGLEGNNIVQVNSSQNGENEDPEQKLDSSRGPCPQGQSNSGESIIQKQQNAVESQDDFSNSWPLQVKSSPKKPNNLVSKPAVKFFTILSKKNFTDKDEAIGGSLSEKKTYSQESENYNIKANPKIETDISKEENKVDKGANVCNQRNPSIIISVPYFNPERIHAASLIADQKNEGPNLDQNQTDNSHPTNTETNNFGKNEIIAIPFTRRSSSKQKTEKDSQEKSSQQYFPSVSKILSATMPIEQAKALERWQAKMISEMGEEGFWAYKENMLNNGKMLHSNIETYLRGTPLSEIFIAPSISGHWNSVKNILPEVDQVKVLESRVVHPLCKYSGIVDCVGVFKNQLVVVDWKTSQKQKPFVSMTYDTPLQIAAYIGAINYDPNYSLKIDEGLIVIAYEDGKTGHIFQLKPKDVAKYWDKWLQRLKQFYETESSSS